jgi:putative FmdB family regulatory protein
MPTYEYRCKDCAHTFDAYQSFTDDALTECPECGGLVKKVFGNVGIAFKGSGFYKTDSRSGASSGASTNGNGSGEKKDGAATSSSSDASSSSSDSSSSSTKTDTGTKKESSGTSSSGS